jgi:MazG family protein
MTGLKSTEPLEKLLEVMERLRDPETGCPWDKEQDFKSIVKYTLEEAYEVAEAIENEDMDEIKSELGDLLFQVVYYAQMAKEEKAFDFHDVIDEITEKMIRRHPHVFADGKADKAQDVNAIWEAEKKKEAKKLSQDNNPPSALDNIPLALPAIKRGQKIQQRAAKTGFEWPEAYQVLDKFEEELQELREAMASGQQEKIIDELGDVFFVLTNFGRKLGVDCESSMAAANRKFENRFRGMEIAAREQGKVFTECDLDEQETLWVEQKKVYK